jgi:hypothetical protein
MFRPQFLAFFRALVDFFRRVQLMSQLIWWKIDVHDWIYTSNQNIKIHQIIWPIPVAARFKA